MEDSDWLYTGDDDYEFNNSGGGVGGYVNQDWMKQQQPSQQNINAMDWGGSTNYSNFDPGNTSIWDKVQNTIGKVNQPMWGNGQQSQGGIKAPSWGEGLFGLAKMFMGNSADNGRINARQQALKSVQGAMNPYVPNYQSKLFEMIQNPGSYTQTAESNAALKSGVTAATRMAAAQGRTADIPRLTQNATTRFGMDARNQELNRLAALQNGNESLATQAGNIMGSIGDLEAQKSMNMLQQLGLMGTRAGALPDYSGSQNSQQSLLQAIMLLKLLGK